MRDQVSGTERDTKAAWKSKLERTLMSQKIDHQRECAAMEVSGAAFRPYKMFWDFCCAF